MSVKLLTEHHLELLSLKDDVQARRSLHQSKFHTVGNHMSRLKFIMSEAVIRKMSQFLRCKGNNNLAWVCLYRVKIVFIVFPHFSVTHWRFNPHSSYSANQMFYWIHESAVIRSSCMLHTVVTIYLVHKV